MSTLKVDAIRHNSATSDAITTSADGTCTAQITGMTGGGALSHRNIIINGAMTVAQRGVTSTSTGKQTVDRFGLSTAGVDEAMTQAQVDVASGTTPYSLGFRKAYKITNGNQTGGAGTGDRCIISYAVESQDNANSGWNYTSSSSFTTLSFWAKSSVAQTFYVALTTQDGTQQRYGVAMTFSSTNTWTKFTYKIPGASGVQFDNDNDRGLQIFWTLFRGTDTTDNSFTLNQWAAYNSSIRYPDITGTWFTTNDATFELTGVQLEVGDTATSFEFRNFGEELNRCQRYYQQFIGNSDQAALGFGRSNGTTVAECNVPLSVPLRASPSLNSCNWAVFTATNQSNVNSTTPSVRKWDAHSNMLAIGIAGLSGMTNARTLTVYLNSGHTFSMDAEM